jgi:hypothetical protein
MDLANVSECESLRITAENSLYLGRYKSIHYTYRGVVSGGAEGAMALPDFGRSVNPISTKGEGANYAKPNDTGTSGFSELPSALIYTLRNHQKLSRATKLMTVQMIIAEKWLDN